MMSSPFEVTPKEVSDLTQDEFIRVMNSLLMMEARRRQIPPDKLDLSWRARVRDGGVDASVDATGHHPNWAPDGYSIWQFRAGEQDPSDIRGEVGKHALVKDELRKGALYVLCVNRQCTAELRLKFERELEGELAKNRFAGRGKVLVGEDIARWGSEHIGIATLEFRHPIGDLLTVPDWTMQHSTEFRPTRQQATFVSQLVDDFTSAHHGPQTYRVQGPSGVGKSRMVLEAVAGSQDRLLYAPDPSTLPNGFFGWLRGNQEIEAILVVDECDSSQAARCDGQVGSLENRVRLITIGDGPRLVGSAEGQLYLDTAGIEELQAIIAAAAPGLTEESRMLAAHLASGYVRAAVLISRNYQRDPTMVPAQLAATPGVHDFLVGLLGPGLDAETRAALSGASLFTYLPFDEARHLEVEMTARFVGLTVQRFRDCLVGARERGVVQMRGSAFYVTPEILAIRLVGDLWGTRPAKELLRFYFELPSEDSRQRFLKRLASLGDDERTRGVVAQLLADPELFRDHKDLFTPTRSALFRYLTEANPTAGLAMLERVLGPATLEELQALNGGRRDVVATLEKLAWLPDTFDGAARLLLALAEAENEQYSNNATGIWCQLFRPYLSGSAKPGLQRLELLEGVLLKEGQSLRRRELAVDALGQIFELHVSRMAVMYSLAGRPLPPESRPSPSEAAVMLDKAFDLLVRVVWSHDSALRDRAIALVLGSLRSMLAHGLGGRAIPLLQAISKSSDPERRAAIVSEVSSVLAFDEDHLTGDLQKGLESLRDELLAGDFDVQLRRWLGKPSPGDWRDESGNRDRSRALADQAWRERRRLESNWAWLLSDEAHRSWEFFVRLGELDNGHEIAVRLDSELANPSTWFAWSAVLQGHRIANRNEWVEEQLGSRETKPETAPAVLDAVWRSEASHQSAIRIARMLRSGVLPGESVGRLVLGNWIGKISADDARDLVRALLERQEAASDVVALSLLGMRLGSSKLEELRAFSEEVWDVLERTVGAISDSMQAHHWGVLGELMLQLDPVRVGRAALRMLETERYISESDPRVTLLLEAARKEPDKIWAFIGKDLERPKMWFNLRHALGGRLLSIVPTEIVQDWVLEGGEERAVKAAQLSSVGPILTPLVRFLLIEFPRSQNLRSVLLANMYTGAYSGPRSLRYKQRLEWIRSWAQDQQPEISTWARGLIVGMEEQVRQMENEEAEEELDR